MTCPSTCPSSVHHLPVFCGDDGHLFIHWPENVNGQKIGTPHDGQDNGQHDGQEKGKDFSNLPPSVYCLSSILKKKKEGIENAPKGIRARECETIDRWRP